MTDATHAAFALALHRKLPTGNRCWSPFPVAAALCGATGVAGEDTGVAVARMLGSDVERTAELLAIAAGEDAVTSTDTIRVDPSGPLAEHPGVRRLVLDENAHVEIMAVRHRATGLLLFLAEVSEP